MSQDSDKSRKQVGTLFLDLEKQSEDVNEANDLLKSIGHGVNLDMSDIVKKQVKQTLEALVKEVKNAAKNTQNSTNQMSQNMGSFGAVLQTVEKQTDVWSGKMLNHFKSVKKGVIDGKEVTQVWRNGKLERQSTIEVDQLQEAKKKYAEIVEKIEELTKAKIELHKIDKSDPSYQTQEKRVSTLEAELKTQKQQSSVYSDLIRQRSKLTSVGKLEKKMEADVNKEIEKNDIAQANKLYVDQVKNLERMVVAYERYANAENSVERDYWGKQFNNLVQIVALKQQEIDLIDEEIVKKSQLSKLDQESVKAANWMSSIADNVGFVTDDEADRLAKRLLNDYKELLSVREKLQSVAEGSTEEKVLKAEEERLAGKVDKQLKMIDQIQEEIVERTRLKSIEDNMKLLEESFVSKKPLEDAKRAYKELIDADKKYRNAVQRGDKESASTQKAIIDSKQKIIELALKATAHLPDENKIRKEILNYSAQTNKQTKETVHWQGEHKKKVEATKKEAESLAQKMEQWILHMVQLNGLKTLWQNATKYVQEYYDKLNEVRIVTGATEEEASRMGEVYQQMAKQMNVSSLEIATAAVEFWRQGLGESEVNSRLIETTKYAKIAGLEFQEAAEQVTAATNSMNLSATKVVDVFSYLGDASASGADEIGTAMQKASAAAQEFGLSFEWQGAYIATISEKTRQAPEVIGTSQNSILARLHSIKQTGYNSEDETTINDIAKALDKIGISLMNNQNEWNSLDVIFNQVAAQWQGQDDKTKSYIATTIAGTRQQNYFLTLMGDLAKSTEGASKALELYVGSLNAAGTAAEKYAIWQESVTAAQNEMKASLEELYSLVDADWMKSFYKTSAGFISSFAQGTDSLKGWNIGISALSVVLIGFGKKAKEATGLWKAFTAAFAKHPFGFAAVVVGLLSAAFTSLVGSAETAAEKYAAATMKMNETSEAITSLTEKQQRLGESFDRLAGNRQRTNVEEAEYVALLDEIRTVSPTAKKAMDDFTAGMIEQAEASKILNEELEKQIANKEKDLFLSAQERYVNWTPSEEAKKRSESLTMENLEKALGFKADGSFVVDPEEYVAQVARGDFGLSEAFFGVVNNEIKKGLASGLRGDALNEYLLSTAMDISAFEDTVSSLIADSLKLIDSKTNSLEKGYLKNRLYEMIIGDNGRLDWEDVENAKVNISGLINSILNDRDISQIDSGYSKGIIDGFVQRVFGTDLPDALRREIDFFSNNPKMAKAISDCYEQMLQAGFSDVQIAKMFDKNQALSDQIALGVSGLYERALEKSHGVDLSKFTKQIGNPETLQFETQVLDEEAKALMLTLLNAGKSVEDLNNAFSKTTDIDSYKAALRELAEETAYVSGDDSFGGGFKSYGEQISEYSKELETLRSVLDSLKSVGSVDQADWLELLEKHPDLLGVEDQDARVEALTKKMSEAEAKIDEAWLNWVMSSKEVAESAGEWEGMLSGDVNTLGLLYETMEDGAKKDALYDYMVRVAQAAKNATGELKAYGEIEAKILRAKGLAENIKTIDPANGVTDASEQLKAYDTLEKTYPILLGYERGSAGYLEKAKGQVQDTTTAVYEEAAAWGVVVDRQARISQALADRNKDSKTKDFSKNGYQGGLNYLADGQKSKANIGVSDDLTAEAQVEKRAENIKNVWNEMIAEIDSVGLLEPMVKMFGDFTLIAEECGYDIEEIIAKIQALKDEATGTELSDKVEDMQLERERNYAAADGYSSELNLLEQASSANEVLAVYSNLDETIRNGLVESYGSLAVAMNKMIKAQKKIGDETYDQTEAAQELAEATEEYERELKKAQKASKAKYFKDTTKAIEDLEDGTIDVSEAMETYADDMEKANEAMTEYEQACKKIEKGGKVAAEDIEKLAEYLDGVDPSWLIDNWDSVGPAISNALAEGEDAFRRLQEAAFIHIVGTSDVDFSDVENGLFIVQNEADKAIQELINLGLFKVEERLVNGWADVYENGQIVRKQMTGKYNVLVPTGNNPFKRKSGTGTGSKPSGGGGSSSKDNDTSSSRNEMSEVEKMLDLMEQVADIQGHKRSLYSAAADMYEGRGELTNAIAFYEKEIAVIEEQNETLEANVKKIEQQLAAKKKEVAAMSTSDEQYEQAASDLKALQEAHQDYTLELLENETAIYDLTEAIEDQQDAIRDMEIELRETILEAIEDREELQERMLQGTIDTENAILDLLIKRYEKERDELLEIAELKRDSLQEELDLLDEQLQKRKQLAEEEDKAAKLAQLEAQLARISADPTRAKEQLELQKEIKELREEIAWDLAEKETDAQKENLEEQITNVEDYMEYVESYYEDLFNHPRKLVEELNALLQKSDEEIMKWLQENSEEYKEATEATQQDMVNSWQAMLDDMHGNIKTYWDEVESIIEQGDEAIIEFLKQNSADYKEAGKLQAEAYVDQWLDQLEALKNAYKNTYEEIQSYDYVTVQPSTGSGSSSSGSGSSGGSSGGNALTHWKFNFNGKEYLHYASESSARSKIDSLGKEKYNSVYSTNIANGASTTDAARSASAASSPLMQAAISSLTSGKHPAYLHGGLVDFTGPAWVDGTKTKPEAFLSASQTEMISSLAKALEAIKIRIPAMPKDYVNYGDREDKDAVQILGDLIIQVQQMETEEDIEKMIGLIEKELYSKISRGAAVGGIRIR